MLGGGALALTSLALTIGFGWTESTPLELAFWLDPRGWFDLVMAGLFAWALGGAIAIERGTRRDLSELRPALERGTEIDRLTQLPSATPFVCAIGAVAVSCAVNFAPGNWPEGRPGITDSFFVWVTLRTTLIAFPIVWAGVLASTFATRLSRLGPMLRVDDLLDLRPLAPLGRNGLRNVAVWVGISAFFAAMLIAPFGRSVAVINLLVSAVIGAAAFLAPVRGAHRRLTELRDAELAHVRSALHSRLASTQVANEQLPGHSLADLLAWEARIERVRTWPFDTSTLARFALYLSIGLGSWIGAALVERALGAALG